LLRIDGLAPTNADLRTGKSQYDFRRLHRQRARIHEDGQKQPQEEQVQSVEEPRTGRERPRPRP